MYSFMVYKCNLLNFNDNVCIYFNLIIRLFKFSKFLYKNYKYIKNEKYIHIFM